MGTKFVLQNSLIETVRRIAPHARDNYLDAIRRGGPLFERHGITTPLRIAHFLAQALHETGGFTVLRENMNYPAARLVEIFGVHRHSAALTASEAARLAGHPAAIAERVYGLGNPRKARELGNTQPGDGFFYRGNGVLQTTGRGNHRRMGAACGLDLEGDPGLAVAPEHALKPALHEWTEKNLNAFADKNDLGAITRHINGGFTGFADRESWFDEIWRSLDIPGRPVAPWEACATDNAVKRLQKDLNDLGANPKLDADGRYGPATRQAVRDFQAAAGLRVDGIAGPVTLAAIRLRLDTIGD